MRKALIPALLVVLLSVVLGATVFREPVAWAAQTVDATIIGPLDGNGNVMVHEQGTAKVSGDDQTQRVLTHFFGSTFETVLVHPSAYREIRVTFGCETPSNADLDVNENFGAIPLASLSCNQSKVIELPGTSLSLVYFPLGGPSAGVIVDGRNN